MSRLRILSWFAVFSAICTVPSLSAQVSTVAPRIVGPVDENSLAALKGNLSALARPQFDQGQADPSTVIPYVRVVLSRSPQQEAALEQFMAQQLDKNSPNYHRWLTPEQFGILYGAADSDIAAVAAWLQSHGLKIETVSPGKTDIAFSGTVAQIEAALHTSIHSFQVNGRQFYSNTSAPRIPSALTPVVSGFARLNTLEPSAHSVLAKSGKYDPQVSKFVPADASSSLARPDLTTSGSFLWTVPADAATIYDTPNSYNAAFSGTSYTGNGVTIGIGGDGAIQASTVVDFRSKFLNGDTVPPTITDAGISKGAAQANGDTDEAYLDNEVAGGLAPGATIHFYVADRNTSGGITTAVEQMISDNKVDIISLSFGQCEMNLPTVDNQLVASWWQQASSQGIAVVVSTGDSGSAGCDDQGTETAAIDGLQVSGFATTPYNIAVGGTDFYGLLNSGFSKYVNNNQTSSNSWRSALGYIPESTWNDSTSNNGQISANVPYMNTSNNNATDIIGGSGGASSCSTNTDTINQTTGAVIVGTCTSGYPKPTWQRGAGVPADAVRDVPDVALFAANGFDGATWLVCTDDTEQNSNSQTVTENCTTQSDGSFYWAGIGGTSASTPAFAGILAMVTQKAGGRIGLDGAKILYDIYNGAQSAAVFHDITQGNNSVICTSGTPKCTTVGGSFFLSGYNTTTGYDLATGLGSVDATKLVNAYSSSTGSGQATISATATPSAIESSQAVSVAVTVSGSGTLGTPTGTVTISGGGYTSSAENLTAGAYTFDIPANSLSGGNDSLTVTYSGDVNYAGTTASTTVMVTQSTFTLAATAPSAVNPGSSATSTITVTSTAGYAGAVTISCTVTGSPSGATNIPTCSVASGSPVTLSSSAASGTATVSVGTTAASAASLDRRGLPGWTGPAGGAVLALLVFFGIPARRRSWRNMLGLLVLILALGSLSACNSKGGSGGGGGGGNPGTTAGSYTITVTGTGAPSGGSVITTTFQLTVN